MNYAIPLSPAETHALDKSMPKSPAGSVISLYYVPPGQLPAYELQWGAWLRENPKHLWPNWAPSWIDKRKAEQAKRDGKQR